MKSFSSTHAIRVFALLLALLPLLNCGTGTKLDKITVAPANQSLAKGENLQLSATGFYSDGTQQNLTDSVAWQISKNSIASINDQGLATGMGEGASQVSASYQGVTGSTNLTVGAPALLSISVTPTPSSVPLGESEQLTATGTYSDGTTQDVTQSATWSTSGTGIASVNATGSVVAAGMGTANITAASGSVNGSASVTVGQAVLLGITVSPSQMTVPLGESRQLTATGKYSDGSMQDLTQSAAWASSAKGVITVSAPGSVLANGNGSATVTASLGTTNGSSVVAVGQAALMSIAVNPAQSSLPVGESEQLTAKGTYSDGTTQDLTQTVTWSLPSSAPIANVSAGGIVVAGAVGTATINATSGSVTGTAGLTVTPAVVVSLNVLPATMSIVLGTSRQLQAMATWSDGSTQDVTTAASWSATPASIVGFSHSALVTAQNVGTTTIFANYGSVTGTSNLTVTPLLFVNYFSVTNAQAAGIDGTMRITNPGLTAGDAVAGNLCAMIYVFDANEELNECCGCFISDGGYRELSLLKDLTANPLTGIRPSAGAVLVVSSDISQNPQCNAGSLNPNGAIAAWETNLQDNGDGTFQQTETGFDSVPLNNATTASLAGLCSFAQTLGSGQGICSCGSGGK